MRPCRAWPRVAASLTWGTSTPRDAAAARTLLQLLSTAPVKGFSSSTWSSPWPQTGHRTSAAPAGRSLLWLALRARHCFLFQSGRTLTVVVVRFANSCAWLVSSLFSLFPVHDNQNME